MKTDLFEFRNIDNNVLRGIITSPDNGDNNGLICLHGFERCSTTEKKFKKLADIVIANNISTFRMDFAGCGLSDGDFKYTTIASQAEDFVRGAEIFMKHIGKDKVSIVAHSLGACVLAESLKQINNNINKIILISPALNQQYLLRYWFVTSQMKKINPDIEITWQNFLDHLDEKAFIDDCERTDKMSKANYINPDYFMNSQLLDYSSAFNGIEDRVLHIHGAKDTSVPIESINTDFLNKIIVENGDHDLERPNQIEQWINKASEFLTKSNLI